MMRKKWHEEPAEMFDENFWDFMEREFEEYFGEELQTERI